MSDWGDRSRVKEAEGTDPADGSPPAFSGACFCKQISRQIFTLLVSHALDDVCAAVCHCFASCSQRDCAVLGFSAKPPA